MGIAACLMGLFTLSVACDDDDKLPGEEEQPAEEIEAVEMEPLPTTDQLTVKLDHGAYVMKGDYSGVGKAIIDRLPSQTSSWEDSQQTMIVHDNQIFSMSDEDYAHIIDLLVKGGSFIYCEPTEKNSQALFLTLGLAIQQQYNDGEFEGDYDSDVFSTLDMLSRLMDEGLNFDEESNASTEPIFDVLVIQDYDFYIVEHLQAQKTPDVTVTKKDEQGNTLEEVFKEDVISPLTDYQYGLQADMLAEWLNEGQDALLRSMEKEKERKFLRSTLRGATEDLQEIADCQKVTRTWMAYDIMHQTFSLPIKMTFSIWSVYAPLEECDYYLIHQRFASDNSKLECGPDHKRTWVYQYGRFGQAADRYKPYYGAWMDLIMIQNEFNGGGAELYLSSPLNAGGSTEYTESIGFELSAGLSYGDGASISGSFSMNASWTTSIPDLKMTHAKNGDSPSWTYEAGNRPTTQAFPAAHTLASDILITDCEVGQCVVWKKPAKANSTETFSFTHKSIVRTAQMSIWQIGIFWSEPEYYTHGDLTNNDWYTMTIPLNAPPRSSQDWEMLCEPYSNELQTFLEKNYGNYWQPYFSIAVPNAEDRTMIDERIAAFENVLSNSKRKFELAGFKGQEFTFQWKLEGTSEIYHTFKMTID